MRFTFHTLTVVLLIACCPALATAEGANSWWWPWGGQRAEDAPPVAQTTAPPLHTASAPATNDQASWPELKLPHLWPSSPPADDNRNAWAKPTVQPKSTSPWHMVTDGAHRLGTSTRNAWHKTVDVLNPFDNNDQSVARRQPPQSSTTLWTTLFGAGESEPQRARTITEWIAQERLDP